MNTEHPEINITAFMVFGLLCCVVWWLDTNSLEDHAASIFRGDVHWEQKVDAIIGQI